MITPETLTAGRHGFHAIPPPTLPAKAITPKVNKLPISLFEVLNSPYNNEHAKAIIGLKFEIAPSYTETREVTPTSGDRWFKNYAEWQATAAK